MKFFFSNCDSEPVKDNESIKSAFANNKERAKTISHLLKKTIYSNNSAKWSTNIDIYTAHSLPKITFEAYLLRFMEYLTSNESIYIAMLIYLDYYLAKHPSNYLTPLNAHRLIVCCILLAHKFHEDIPYSNTVIAKIAGLSVKELNYLEWKFYAELNQELFISTEEYESCHQNLLRYPS